MNNTADKIEKAVLCIEKGRPKVVAHDRQLSITSVAEEAGIHRTTIINRHPQLAEIIRQKCNIKNLKENNKTRRVKELELELKEAKLQISLLRKQLAKAISLQAKHLSE